MKFEIETDTLRAHGDRGLNGRWTWEITRAGVAEDAVYMCFSRGETDDRLVDVITHVLGELASVAQQQADSLADE